MMFRAIELKCEDVINPCGIDNPFPVLSWKVVHDEEEQYQQAYQVIVADDYDLIRRGEGNIWNSGKVDSNKTRIKYEGEPLQSRKIYYWRVKWWDKEGRESLYSEIAVFETAFLKQEEWCAKWIRAPEYKFFETEGDGHKPQEKYLLTYGVLARKEFEVSKQLKRARLYITGVGYYVAYVNGRRLGDNVLMPAQTDYKKTVLYSTYDITQFLREGTNVIGVMLGNGRYIKNYGYEVPCLIAQLHITYENGEEEIIISDKSWKFHESPIRENGIYYGEVYDARMEVEGWNTSFFEDDGKWKEAIEIEGPGGILRAEIMPAIKICKTIFPQQMTEPKPGVYVFDFGQEFSGWVRVKVKGNRGDCLKIRYAELLNEDGTLNVNTNRTAKAMDEYILKGEEEEIFEPHFTYHAFRYVEVTGYPGVPSIDSIEGRCVHTDVKRIGNFSCSSNLLNKIHETIVITQLCNLMSIPTDCPQRAERMGWLGDAHLTAEEAILNFDMLTFYKKFLRDIRDSQKEDGSLPDVVPPYWPFYPADPAWGTAYISIAWELYRYYKAEEVLEEHYENMKKWVRFLESNEKEGLIEYVKYGEWCSPGSIKPKHTPPAITSAFYYYLDVSLLAEISKVLGRTSEYESLKEKAEKIREAFNKKYFNKDRYFYGNNDQTSNVLGLQMAMVGREEREKVLGNLIRQIVEVNDYHFDTGIIGTKYILEILSENGYVDIAYKMMTQETYPSFGYMLKEGATTLWERWEKLTGKGMNSHNHIMFGTVDAWFYKYLAGINVASPGWEEIMIRPVIPKDLKWAEAEIDTPKGLVISKWRISEDGNFVLEVQIPINTKGLVCIPDLDMKKKLRICSKNGKEISLPVREVKMCGMNYFTVQINGGNYCFELR